MKKKVIFAIKCILVMMPFILISLYCKTNQMAFIDTEAPYYIWNRDFCTETHDKVYNTVILGDSVANAAYMPEVLSDSTVNLSLGGATMVENYYVMKQYLENNEAPKDVFISYTDVHLTTSNCFWDRTIYSHRFSAFDNWEMLQKAKKYGEESIATENCYLDFIAYELYLPSKYITALSNAGFNQRLEENEASYQADELHKGRYIAIGVDESPFEGKEFTSYVLDPVFDYYYKQTIELCVENGINVHIIKLPLPACMTFTEEYRTEFREYYDALKAEYPSITVDWLDEIYDDYCFTDNHHMNNHGAFRFSRELKELYPEAFDDNYSNEQAAAIDANIQQENRIEEVFSWGSLTPYTMIVYDAAGNFEETYNSQFSQDNLIMKNFAVNGSENTNIYVLGSSEEAAGFDRIYLSENGYKIDAAGNGEADSWYEWCPRDTSGYDILLIDNYNGSVVSEKKYDYVNAQGFTLR